MGIRRENPLGIEATGQLPSIEANLLAQVSDLHQRIESADRAREPWMSKQRRLLEQRRGVRRKTNFPWPGAANDSWPITDSVIRRWKPPIIRLVLSSDPVAYFHANTPDDVEPAQVAQDYYHWKFHKIPQVHKTVFSIADNIAQYGVAYTRQGWEYRTDKSCRIVKVETLFPGGVEAALDQFNQQSAQVAAEQGQPPPQGMSPEEFVKTVLVEEYQLDEETEGDMIERAVANIMQGASFVKLYFEEVVADRPSFKVLNPMHVIRPPRGTEVSEDEFLVVLHEMSKDEILRSAHDGIFMREAAAMVVEKMESEAKDHTGIPGESGSLVSSQRFYIEQIQDTADGVEPTSGSGPRKDTLWEIFVRLDIDGDGLKERTVVWYHPSSKTILSAINYPFPFKEWPIVEFPFEYNDNRPYSARGIPEFLNAHQKVATRMHNARLDSVAVTLAPMYQAKTTAGNFLRTMKFRPGLIIPVQNVGDIQPVQTDVKPLQFLLQEENLTRSQAEQYIGIFDPGVFASDKNERRTATEVEAVTGQSDNVFSQDAILFQRAMAQVHRQLWLLILEFGPEEEYFRVTGEQQPRLARRAELDRDFDIAPAGTPESTSKTIAIRNAQQALQLATQDQSGVLDLAAIYTHYLNLLDRNLSKLAVRSTQEQILFQQLVQGVQQLEQAGALKN